MRIRILVTLFALAMASNASAGNYFKTGLYVQTEAIFLSPISENPVQTFQVQDAGGTVTPTATGLDADQFVFTPRITIGQQLANGWGFQARYWELNASDGNGFGGIFPNPATPSISLISGVESVEAYTVDLELTKCFCFRGQNILGTFGVRHGALEHSTAAAAFGQGFNPVTPDNYFLSALSDREFHGTGITYSLSGIRNISRCRSLSLYGGARLSHLFGTNQASAVTTSLLGSTLGGTAFSTNGAIASNNDALFIAETNAGIQWAHCLKRCNAECFARLGVEYQYWNAGNVGAAAISATGTPGSLGAVTSTAANLETHFIGLGFSTGFSF